MKSVSKLLLGAFCFAGMTGPHNSAHAQSQNTEKPAVWSAGLGLGPNFSQLDAVNDSLKSSLGATAWVSREWGSFHRADLSFDYFSLTNRTDYHALSLAYGLSFMPDEDIKPFAMLGAGIGKANNFPFAVNTNQNTTHLFFRAGADDLYRNGNLALGVMADFFIVKLDGNAVKTAYMALPMLTLRYLFEKETKPVSQSQAAPQKAAADGDADQDGVRDSRDECPNTPRGSKVNSIGCPPKAAVKKNLRIEFATDKAAVLPAYYNRIAEFAQYLRTNSDLKVTIEGHTDDVGSKTHNQKLSQDRANSVRAMLIGQHQIKASRIKAIGYGSSRPEVRSKSESVRQANRRVIAVLR